MTTSLRILASLLVALSLGLAHDGIVVHGSQSTPHLPATAFNYAAPDLPGHFTVEDGRRGRLTDNTPHGNPITDDGATLGRVLFYDTRLSANDTVACSSCHMQEYGFADPRRLSVGLNGEVTRRHSMALANARYYSRGRFFWDERAATLEDQVLMPIEDPIEMDMSLEDLEAKLGSVDFYAPLFAKAFGSSEITSDRISRALAQFVRSMVSYRSRYDEALAMRPEGEFRGFAGFDQVFTDEELLGLRVFGGRGRGGGGGGRGGGGQGSRGNGGGGGFGQDGRGGGGAGQGGGGRGGGGSCASCHTGALQFSTPRNNGLDTVTDIDDGAGRGRFKAPSLRNVAVRAPYMHDGRFDTLREVIEHYNSGVQPHPDLARQLTGRNGEPRRLNLSGREIDALVAFLETLTDEAFLTDLKFSDPFLQ